MAKMTEQQKQVFNLLAIVTPIFMVVVALVVYFLWDDPMAPLFMGLLILIGVTDFFVFRWLASRN